MTLKKQPINPSHRIHVWYIYLHLVDFHGKYIGKYTFRPMDPLGMQLPGRWRHYPRWLRDAPSAAEASELDATQQAQGAHGNQRRHPTQGLRRGKKYLIF